jgi:hypothetical protein
LHGVPPQETIVDIRRINVRLQEMVPALSEACGITKYFRLLRLFHLLRLLRLPGRGVSGK